MPTSEVVTQHALQLEKGQVKVKDASPPSLSPPNPLTSDKRNYYGIEVREKLIWKGWEQGKEYIKTLVLKNLGVKTQKLKYKVPNTRFFTTLYPKPIFLSAGSSFTLPVTFRPLENIEYNDKIVFLLKGEAGFEVPLSAVLPKTDICLPIDLDFKMCAVQDSIFILFDVFNTGDLDTFLKWEIREPFMVEPAEAELKRNGSYKFRAIFRPKAACVYEATAVCRFGKDLQLVGQTTFYGIGKFPHLLVSCPGESVNMDNLNKTAAAEAEIRFGKVAVSTTEQLFVELHNISPVQSPFHVEKLPGMNHMNTVFQCLQMRGVVPPMSLMKIPIIYSPHTVGVTSIDYFDISSVGGFSHSRIKCVGTAVGSCVELSTYCIAFKETDLGTSATSLFDIINKSDTEVAYQFEVDCEESVFHFSKTSGWIKPSSRETLQLRFVPQYPINYYRRVTFLVHNQSPLYLDLLATCHSETVKPAVLKQQHLVRYQTHVERGLSIIPPEQLNELIQSGRLQVDPNGCLDAILAEDKANLKRNPHPADILPEDEYLNDGFHCDLVNILPHVSLDVNVLDFGNVRKLNAPEERTVNITNHTKGKVTVQWMGGPSHVFSVSPVTQDVPPMKSCSFRVRFQPEGVNKMYGNELECFVYYKSMRDYRLVQDQTMCPPWCLTVRCLGHTFVPNNETFLPRAVISPSVVVFPAVNIGENAHQTLLLANEGDTPILYDLTPNFAGQGLVKARCGFTLEKNVFTVKPCQGLLKSGCQVVSLRMTPNEVKTFSHDLLVRLNDNEKYNQVVHLCGSAENAQVLLDNEGQMYLKPTCAGTSSSRAYGFKNISRIPLQFKWKLNRDDEKYIQVEPGSGIVQPNESVGQTWTFTPAEQKKYVMKAILIAWGQGLNAMSSGGKRQTFSVRIIGQGFYGDLQSDQTCVDFGDILVGSSASCPINVFNNSNCSLLYRLIIDNQDYLATPSLQARRHYSSGDTTGVEFSPMSAEVPPRGKHSILATIKPTRRLQYQFAVSYQLVTAQDRTAHPAALEPQHLVHLLANGVYPSMTAVDIHGHGSAIGFSKKSLWKLFSLNDFNSYLESDPTSNELFHSTSAHPSHVSTTNHQQHVLRNAIDFNFSAAPLGSDPTTITIMLHNCRTVLCEWAFLFTKDMQIEMGHWTESGECTQDELQEMKIMDNKLFDVTPKKGSLKPGESVSVTFTYLHTIPGVDHMPVLLKIVKGREIMLNFIGATVEQGKPYIHFPSNKHIFNPIPIGERFSPSQVYELYNGGDVPLAFEADLTELRIVKEENFDQAIFECLTPNGTIQPGQTKPMEWRFSPLEAKTYTVNIPIKVHNGDTTMITFTGVGYDQRDVESGTVPLSDGSVSSGVPSLQKQELPGQLGCLSMERISFGNLPLFSITRRMVFITNKSKDRSIFFEWHVTSVNDSKFVHIYPMRGKIGPDDCKMCRVSFFATAGPAFYDIDLVCEISDLHEYTNYKRELAAWQAERERQTNQFTITENDPHADMRSPDVVTVVTGTPSRQMSKLEALADGRKVTSDMDLSKYQTLPPIRQLTVDEQRLRDWQLKKKLSQLWVKPQPQKPFLLHLGITARTHNSDTFQINFPDDLNNFYIDQTLSESDSLLEPYGQDSEPPKYIQCTSDEAKAITSVLGICLRGLMDDAHFIQAVRKVVEEPIPYFCQLTDVQSGMGVGSTDNLESRGDEERTPNLEDFDQMASMSVVSDTMLNGKAEHTIEEQEMAVSTNMSMPFISIKDPEIERLDNEARMHKLTQAMKRLPEFGHLVEQVLENTIVNLVYEAMTSEQSIISRPRLIAMSRRMMSEVTVTSDGQFNVYDTLN